LGFDAEKLNQQHQSAEQQANAFPRQFVVCRFHFSAKTFPLRWELQKASEH